MTKPSRESDLAQSALPKDLLNNKRQTKAEIKRARYISQLIDMWLISSLSRRGKKWLCRRSQQAKPAMKDWGA
jgi:hypothetical protein